MFKKIFSLTLTAVLLFNLSSFNAFAKDRGDSDKPKRPNHSGRMFHRGI
ncbi:MAG: hypothetical protein FWG90_12400 [Oscillospiraceae bacterium]|nr:hypothetical protein [Oscillospiraceae bacterium]